MGVAILDIDKISAADQAFDANFYYILRWADPRLAHDQERKSMPLNEVWHPRFLILNQPWVWASFPEWLLLDLNCGVSRKDGHEEI